MTKWDQQKLPALITIQAIDELIKCLTERDKELLKIERNGQVVTVGEQFLARWWNHLPLADSLLAFRAKALQILDAQRRWLDFIEKIKTQDIFAALLDPENYKEKHNKTTRAKVADKRIMDVDSGSLNLVKTLARTIAGDGAINRAYDYNTDWDKSDRERLDNMKIIKSDKSLLNTETGEEDDTLDPTTQEEWIDKKERLDQIQGRRLAAKKPEAKFVDNYKELPEKNIMIFDANLAHSTNSTLGEMEASTNSFVEGLKRQHYITTRDRLILAQAINQIQNLDFIDPRERFYKYFDSLFYSTKKPCR